MLNRILMMGRLTRDPELRRTQQRKCRIPSTKEIRRTQVL